MTEYIVKWSLLASKDFSAILEYLCKEFGAGSAQNFIIRIEKFVSLIEISPFLYPLSDYRNVRKAVLNKQASIYYKLEGSQIVILRVLDNRRVNFIV